MEDLINGRFGACGDCWWASFASQSLKKDGVHDNIYINPSELRVIGRIGGYGDGDGVNILFVITLHNEIIGTYVIVMTNWNCKRLNHTRLI